MLRCDEHALDLGDPRLERTKAAARDRLAFYAPHEKSAAGHQHIFGLEVPAPSILWS